MEAHMQHSHSGYASHIEHTPSGEGSSHLQHAHSPHSGFRHDEFPTDPRGLPPAETTPIVELADGESYELRVEPIRKRIGDDVLRMVAYNRSVPGPTLKVKHGSEVSINVVNGGDVPTTIHWHGIRLPNQFDGVPFDTQEPIGLGGEFTYRVPFPDAGIFWYHPHLREDYAQELGMYGNILVVASDPDYWPPVNREVVVALDDILIEDGAIAPFRRSGPTHTAMGRFGNVLLVNGETALELDARLGEVVRLYVTNAANTRTFNLRIPRARIKLVGGDSGRYERETFVEEVLISPSERAVVDVLFDEPGVVPIEHRSPDATYRLGEVRVSEERAESSYGDAFFVLRENPEFEVERSRLGEVFERAPDKTIALLSEMPGMMHHGHEMGSGHGGHHAAAQGPEGRSGHEMPLPAGDGIEWEDNMPEMNVMSNPENMIWKLVDVETGRANAEIDWSFRLGDRIKLRLDNSQPQAHPMQHPLHVHGLRFLVVSRNGVPNSNLVWKDSVLVRDGEVVDILIDMTNPGRWMAHCHIAEHTESGMMFSFDVISRE